MITPPLLHPGNTIGIAATGKRITPEAINAAIPIFESWGLKVMQGANLYSTDHNYLAGTDEQRLKDFQTMVDDPSVKAIICARGGYGTTRIIDDIDFFSMKTHPKWIVGYSDVTTVHLMLSKLGIQSIHGIMPINFASENVHTSIESLHKILFGRADDIRAMASPSNRSGSVHGELIGGNLSLIVDSLGTSNEVDTDGKILVLEEIGEYLYRIDRMLINLKRAGKFDGLAGLMVGNFSSVRDEEAFGGSAYDRIAEHTQEYDFPVAYNFPIGHEDINLAWVHGAEATLSVDNRGALLSFGHRL